MGLILLQKLGFKQHTRSDDMPQGASSTEDASLSHMAPDLDNIAPPTPIRNLLNWRRGVNSTGINDSPTPVGDGPPIVDFSQFTFPPKSRDHWIDLEDAEISRVIRSQVTATQHTLPKSDLLMTLGYVSRVRHTSISRLSNHSRSNFNRLAPSLTPSSSDPVMWLLTVFASPIRRDSCFTTN
jgi:hypothetical protein